MSKNAPESSDTGPKSSKLKAARRRLRRWRHDMDLTLAEVTEAVNAQLPEDRQLSLSTVSSYEAKRDPNFRFLWGLWKAFPEDVDLHWLMYGMPEPPEKPEVEGKPESKPPWWLGTRVEKRYEKAPAVKQWVLDPFLTELAVHYEYYRLDGSLAVKPQLADPSSPLGSLDEWFREIFNSPFDKAPGHFVEPEDVRQAELLTYAHALVTAFRPLLREVRADRRPAVPVWLREEPDEDDGE